MERYNRLPHFFLSHKSEAPDTKIAAEWDFGMQPKTFVDLVRDPNFNKFKYMKHVKLDDERLKCLTNKSIHIQPDYSLPLLEIIALILF